MDRSPMNLQFLAAADGTRLSKRYSKQGSKLLKSAYPLVSHFDSYLEPVTSVTEFHAAIVKHAALGHCLLKGELTQQIKNRRRAGLTNRDAPTWWLFLDVDGAGNATSPAKLFALLPKPFASTSHVLQYSASHGIEGDKALRAHFFFLLAETVSPTVLKLYLKNLTLSIPKLRQAARLSRTKNTIRWPVDISTCQNDKIGYIAPPEITPEVRCSVRGNRIQLIKKATERLELSFEDLDSAQLRKSEDELINELRAKEGLAPRSSNYRVVYSTEVLARPDTATVTGVKEERGFVYLNLNGGDSWGYFHPASDARVIFNFKGEPNYITSELLPDYWQSLKDTEKERKAARAAERLARQEELAKLTAKREERLAKQLEERARQAELKVQREQRLTEKLEIEREKLRERELRAQERKAEQEARKAAHAAHKAAAQDLSSGIPEFAAVIDDVRDDYALIKYDAATNTISVTRTSNSTKAGYFLREHGIIPPAEYERWRIAADPHNPIIVDPDKKQLNTFRLPACLREPIKSRYVPKNIRKLLLHLCSNDANFYELMLHWLAFKVQKLTRPETAIVLSGTQGTGKGVLKLRILDLLFGAEYSHTSHLSSFNKEFNGFLEGKQILIINEASSEELHNPHGSMGWIKELITDRIIPIRRMRTEQYNATNYIGMFIFSNEWNPIHVAKDDRRFHVAMRQETPLRFAMTSEEIDSIGPEDVARFAYVLLHKEYDIELVKNPKDTEQKAILSGLTTTGPEDLIHQIKTGDLENIFANRPNGEQPERLSRMGLRHNIPTFLQFMEQAIKSQGAPYNIPRDELRMLFMYNAGIETDSPTKFSKLTAHKGLPLKKIRVGGITTTGIQGQRWKISKELEHEYHLWAAQFKQRPS